MGDIYQSISAEEYQRLAATIRHTHRELGLVRAANGAGESKYRNKRCKMEVNGVTINFQSLKEARRYQVLLYLEQQGLIKDLKRQVFYDLHVSGQKVTRYIADFVYSTPDDKIVVEDAKGYRPVPYPLKKKMMKAEYGIEIQEV